MKQTAVEWLQEQLECFGNKHELQMSWTTLDELLEQAKEMEKQQIVDFAYVIADDLACGVFRDKEDMEKRYDEFLVFRSEEDEDV
jgi:hypothetical protein